MTRRIGVFILLACVGVVSAHDPAGKPRKPSKAAPIIREAEKKLREYKSKLIDAGEYSCCIKPLRPKAVTGCDLCAQRHGKCDCGIRLAQGHGVCGECKGGWDAGKGLFPGIDSASVTVSPVTARDVVIDDPLHVAYRNLLNTAKRTLVQEGRFNCCVGKGGCDECALESFCGCATNLAIDIAAKPGETRAGVCGSCGDGQHGGIGRLDGVDLNTLKIVAEMDSGMAGSLGPWAMNREGSGTSWLPDSSPSYAVAIENNGDWSAHAMGLMTANAADAGGLRGESQVFANSMLMLMAQKTIGEDTVGVRGMFSFDRVTNGVEGYPNLFQTGETANGVALRDRQHPHDVFMELAFTYAFPISSTVNGFVYLAPVGEPAIGGSAFQHRPSAWENAEAPISHHWFDGTHITYGVATAGLALGDKIKVETSAFNGREPNEDRFGFDPIKFDSYSGRVSYNPNSEWSFSAAYAFLNSPETLEPGEDQHRITGSALFNRAFENGDNFAAALLFGRNIKEDHTSDAITLELSYRRAATEYFVRIDHVEKDELVGVPTGIYEITKWSIGATHTLLERDGINYALGGYIDFHSFPDSLRSSYGSNPVSLGLYLRIRPR